MPITEETPQVSSCFCNFLVLSEIR
uniref:Uncharacterized protein n=1 Tax=Arundo donax TaxID=35708 RepID=A0A0A9FMD3_ARUDO